MSRLQRIQQADAELSRALEAPGNDHIQGQALDAIRRHAFAAGEPVMDLLIRLLKPHFTPTLKTEEKSVKDYREVTASQFSRQCRGCNQVFTNPKVWSGHGESRCIIKHGKEAKP
jgi:hypothetical protein